MTAKFYDTLPPDATSRAVKPGDSVFPFPRSLCPETFDPQVLEWAGTFFAAYNLRPQLREFFDSCYISGRSVRLSTDSAWDRIWSRLLREVGDA